MTRRRTAPPGAPKTPIVVGLKKEARTSTPPPPLILLVDDNHDARAMYSVCLRYAGFACMTAQDGRQAIQRTSERRPALILMDVSMPGMDGWEATLRIKGDPITRDIPIYMLTAHAYAEHRRHAVEVGADGFLTKPMSPDDLVRELRRALNLGDPDLPMNCSAAPGTGTA